MTLKRTQHPRPYLSPPSAPGSTKPAKRDDGSITCWGAIIMAKPRRPRATSAPEAGTQLRIEDRRLRGLLGINSGRLW